MNSPSDPPTSPPCGNTEFVGGSTDDKLADLEADFAALGPVFTARPSPGCPVHPATWVVADPEATRRVLVSNHPAYALGLGFDRIRLLVGDGIIVSEGELWKRQSRMLQPMFQRQRVDAFGPMIAAANQRRLADWERLAASGEPLNLTRDANDLALEITLRALMGADVDKLNARPDGNPFAMLITETRRDLKLAYNFRQLRKVMQRIIDERRQNQDADTEPTDWLGMMLLARDRRDASPMSDREIIDESMSLIVAGHETTGATVNAMWHLLARHPLVEAKVQAEVDQVELAQFSLEAVESLHYCQQVVHETLRLYPPVWILSRRTTQPDELGGYQAPAGTNICLSPYLVQRHPEFWEAPHEFRPERFVDGEMAATRRGSYIPFAAGPRHCVGETMANFEILIHAYLFARRFQLRALSDQPMQLESRINLRTREDLLMRVERRSQAAATSTRQS